MTVGHCSPPKKRGVVGPMEVGQGTVRLWVTVPTAVGWSHPWVWGTTPRGFLVGPMDVGPGKGG